MKSLRAAPTFDFSMRYSLATLCPSVASSISACARGAVSLTSVFTIFPSAIEIIRSALRTIERAGVILSVLLILTACHGVELHNPLRDDQVPDEVKAQPRTVEAAPPLTGNEKFPRLGDVPFMPKDFSTKPVYYHYMDELTFDKQEGKAAKEQVEPESSTTRTSGAAPLDASGAVSSAPLSPVRAVGDTPAPPQF